jgi:hypothetical protein
VVDRERTCATVEDAVDERDAADEAYPTVERALTLVLQRAAGGYDSPGRWETRVRAALSAVLDLFDEQPQLARLCVMPESSPPDALRERTRALLIRRIDDGRRRAHHEPPPHTAHAVLATTLGAIRGRLLATEEANAGGPPTVADLLDPLVSFIVLPYRGAAAARCELSAHRPL